MFMLLTRSRFTLLALPIAFFAGTATPAVAQPVADTPQEMKQAVQINSGRLGFAAFDFQTSRTYSHNGNQPFPMQSVFKAMLAVEVMRQVDEGKLTVDQDVSIGRADLSVYWSPIAEEFDGTIQTFTIRQLLEKSVGWSDNTAADVLMELVGGPEQVTQMLNNAGIRGVRIDRYEREFQPELEGLPPFKLGEEIDRKKFEKTAMEVPAEVKRPILKRYVSGEDERDTATPLGAVDFLIKLQRGELLSPQSTTLLLQIMTDVQTGTKRLKAGLPPGSKFAHKTGTSGDILGINAATNDIGIATLPDGRQFAIAVFLTGSEEPEDNREAIHADIMHAYLDHLVQD